MWTCFCLSMSACVYDVRICVSIKRLCWWMPYMSISIQRVSIFLYRVYVCVYICLRFKYAMCIVVCIVYTLNTLLVVWLPHMNVLCVCPCICLCRRRRRRRCCSLPFTSMMMLLMMNKVVQRTDRVLQPCATVVYFELSFDIFLYDQWFVSSFSRSLISSLLIRLRHQFFSQLFGVNWSASTF